MFRACSRTYNEAEMCTCNCLEVNLVVAIELIPDILQWSKDASWVLLQFRIHDAIEYCDGTYCSHVFAWSAERYIWFVGFTSCFGFNRVSGLLFVCLHAVATVCSYFLFPGLLGSAFYRSYVYATTPLTEKLCNWNLIFRKEDRSFMSTHLALHFLLNFAKSRMPRI